MAYEHTAVPVSRSQEKIRELLLRNGATGVAFVSETNPPSEGFRAVVPLHGETYQIKIAATVGEKDDPRRVWRVLFYHLKSIYEAANSGLMEFRELVLPFVVVKDGRTVAEHILPALDKAIMGSPLRMLGSGKEP